MIATSFIALAPHARASEAKTTLVIGGTGAALGGIRLLADAFSEERPEIKVVVLPSLGSSGGIKALSAGKIDLALSARQLKDAEAAEDLTATLYARTPIVFATHSKTQADSIGLAELTDVYSGATAAWPDGTPLRLILRPDGESDIKLLRGLSKEMDAAVTAAQSRKDLYVAFTDQDNASVLESVPGSLGLTTLAQILSEGRNLKSLSFDGRTASVGGDLSGEHPYFKSFYLVMGKDPSEKTKAFVSYTFSKTGRDILSTSGHNVTEAGR